MAGSAGTARQAGATSWSCRRRARSERARSRRRSHCPLTSVTRLARMLLASVSGSFTSAVANHGVYAVFGLLALGALLPVGSELVALVGGAVAAGALAGAGGVSVFGAHFGSGAGSYIAISLAATVGYLVGCVVGWLIGRWGGRGLVERHGVWVEVTPERI